MARKPLDSYETVAKRVGAKDDGGRSGKTKLTSYDSVVSRISSGGASPQLTNALNNAYNIRLSNLRQATDRLDNWITSDSREDASEDIAAYERALEALRRYGVDTTAGTDWAKELRDANNVVVRENLYGDVEEAKAGRKGTVGQYLLSALATAVAAAQGDTAGMQSAQQRAGDIVAQRKSSRTQQREAEAALAEHQEQYGILTVSEKLEQAYKEENEAQRVLRALNSSAPGKGTEKIRAEATQKLADAQKVIREYSGVADASLLRGWGKSFVGNTGAGVAYGLTGQDTRKQDDNIKAGEAALAEAIENAVASGNRAEEQRLRKMADEARKPGADKSEVLAEFLPGVAEVTDEVALRDRRADLERQSYGNRGYAALKEMAESGSKEIEAVKAGKSEVEKVLIDVAVQGGNMAADAILGIPGTLMGMPGALVPMALRSYGSGVIEAESAGAGQKQAMLYGLAAAGVETLSEKLADGFMGIYGKGVSDNLTDYVIGKLAKSEVGRAAWGMLFSGGGEALEELFSGVVNPVMQSIYNGQSIGQNYSQVEAADLLYDALIGGIMGFMGGTVEGLTQSQDAAANFFRNAAEAGLSPRQAGQIWADTGMAVPSAKTVKGMSQEARAAVVEEGMESAEGTRSRQLAEQKQGKKLSVSDVQAQTIANELAIRREEADADLAAKDVKNQTFDAKKAGDVKLNAQGETVINGQVTKGGVAETLRKMGFNETVAEDMARQYEPGTVTEGQYAMAMNQAYQMARAAVPATEVSADSMVQYLTAGQRDFAIAYGSANRVNAAKAQQEAIRAQMQSKPVKGLGKVLNDTGREINIDSLNEQQKRGLQVAQILTKATRNNVHIFESTEVNGKRVMAHDMEHLKKGDAAPNGWYDHKTGDIYIDINAGNRGKGTVLYTLSHEYTHFIKQWSPEKFEALANFLFENADISIEVAIQNQIAKAEKGGREISRDEAMEEVVADAMETILSDTNAAEKILELRNRDRGLWERLRDLFTKIRDAVRAAYKGLDPDSQEGLMLKRMDDEITEQLATLFAEGVADAAESYSRANVTIDMATESVAPSNSLRTWTKSEYVQEREETAKKISKTLGVSMEKAYEYIDSINSVAKLIADDAVRLDYEPNLNESATALKPNSEYKYTVDMSTLCAKRLLFTGTFDAIQKALPNVAFDSDAIVHLRKMMMDRDYQVACGICYVESTRREIGTITKEFIERYKIAQQSGKPITRLNSEGEEVELQEKGTKRTFMAEDGYTPTLGELNTTDIDIVQRDHPDVYAAYLSFMNARGQAKPKLLETRTEYKGEILKSFNNKRAVASRNAAGGLRLQSFSDFEVPHLIDMMQVVMDMSRVGLMSQAYTKVPAFARAFGETGVKINLSLIAKGDGIDADGNLIFDDVEGINHEEAFAIREQHSKNVGTILVGKNDAHIIAAMADPRIDFIIPFHKSSWKESLYGALGLTGYQDYTTTQNERPIDPNRKIANFAPSEYWDYSKSGDENAQIYLQKCREDGRIPKFPEFQGYPGYWKLLIDFKMYDNDGVGAPQQVVQPLFDDAVNAEILAEYKGGHQSYPVAQDVVDDFVREYKEGKVGGDSISLSARDDDYLAAVERGDMATAQRMVDEAAKAAGYTKKRYHETEQENVIHVFNLGLNTHASSDYGTPFGVFTKSHSRSVGLGGKQMQLYVKAEKTFKVRDRTETPQKLPAAYTALVEKIKSIDDEYSDKYDELSDRLLDDFDAWLDENDPGDVMREKWDVAKPIREQFGDVLPQELIDLEIQFEAMHNEWTQTVGAAYTEAKTWITKWLRDNDYDSMELEYDNGAGNRVTDALIVLDENQVKSAEAVTYDNNWKIIPLSERFNEETPDIRYSLRDETVTDSYILANTDGQNATERRILGRYREEYGVLVGLQETLTAQREALKELQGSEIRDRNVIRAQREGIMATENRINVQQGILARMEDSYTLNRVLQRERESVYLEGFERGRFDQGYETAPQIRREMDALATEEYRKGYERGRFDQGIKMAEQQRLAMEYAEKKTGQKIDRLERRLAEAQEVERRRVQQMVNRRENQSKRELLRKIGKTTKELNDWLTNPTIDKHIPSKLKAVVVEALDAVNMDTVNADERLAILDRRIAEIDKSLSVTSEYANRKRLEDERAKLVRQQGVISKQGYRMQENLSKLQSVYNEIRNSDDPVLAGAFDENISQKIQEVWEYVGDTSLREMRVDQLQMVYDLYRMVSKSVRNGNKAFKAARNATIEGLANSVMNEMAAKGERGGVWRVLLNLENLAWTDMKPTYAFKTLGSETMTELFNAVRAGEDTWATDVNEARSFYLQEAAAHNLNSWDMDEKFSFTSTSGLDFELTLGDIMSIYAYSKREQALDHLAKGGIVLEPPVSSKPFAKVSEKATAYNLSPEILADITGKLSEEQRAFVDAMQDYLSTVMGNKGNEVSEALYDVKLFNEANYFPLRSSKAYMARAKEQQSGEVKIKNSSFTKATTPNASNPIVMQPFMEVWSEHVSDMAMYHAFTLPMEDFYRVYNFGTRGDGTAGAESVTAGIQNVYGKAATDYIDTLLRDINGGARGDRSFTAAARAFSKFKKAAVMASASVVVQQPSAIARAFAYIPVTYFIGPKVNAETHDSVWSELKQYAPVAIIKEIGSFDQNAGKRTVDWIAQKEYGSFMEKVGAFVTDSGYRDDAFGYLAGKADEITWCAIWEAAKRMARDTTNLEGEALLQKAGEIFTETIVNTQVYDSVMSRSQLMRSKDGMAQMLTAFMGEPTTTLNMLYDAVLQAKRGDYGFAAKAFGSVTASIALNSALVAFVKAARDDDEDESYWEKYMAAMFSAFRDGINVAQMVPYLRDLVSLGKGFDVERTDVAVYADIVNAFNKLRSSRKEGEDTVKEYVDFLASFSGLLGIPATNLIRDGRAVLNVITNWNERSTAAGIRDAIREGWTGERKSDAQQLYEALLAGDEAQIRRVTARYETQKEADADLRKYLREADGRVAEAALARHEGRTAEYDRIISEIIGEGKLDRSVIVEAVRDEEDRLKEETVSTETKVSSLYTLDDLVKSYSDGDFGLTEKIRSDIVTTAQRNGKTQREAEDQFRGNASAAAKKAYMDGSINSSTAKKLLNKYAEKSLEESNDTLRAWEFERVNGWVYTDRSQEYRYGNITRSQLKTALVSFGKKTPDEAENIAKVYDWQMDGVEGDYSSVLSMVEKYEEGNLSAAGISRDTWVEAYNLYNDTPGEDKDGDGKNDAYSKCAKVMEKIDALPISNEQKTKIALQFWAKSTVDKYKTW